MTAGAEVNLLGYTSFANLVNKFIHFPETSELIIRYKQKDLAEHNEDGENAFTLAINAG